MAGRCAADHVDHLGFLLQLCDLLQLCELRLIDRERRAADRLLSPAKFPTYKTLVRFFQLLPGLQPKHLHTYSRREDSENGKIAWLFGHRPVIHNGWVTQSRAVFVTQWHAEITDNIQFYQLHVVWEGLSNIVRVMTDGPLNDLLAWCSRQLILDVVKQMVVRPERQRANLGRRVRKLGNEREWHSERSGQVLDERLKELVARSGCRSLDEASQQCVY